MGVTFNPQVGATTQSKIGYGGQAEGVQAAAASGTALKMAKYKQQKSQYDKQLATQKEQFDTRMGMEKSQFQQGMAERKKGQKYQEKRDVKAERIARIGTSVTVAKLGLEMANEFDIDLAENMGFGGDEAGPDVGGEGVGRSGKIQPEAYGDSGLDISEPTAGAKGMDTSEGGEFSARGTAEDGGGGSWWSQHGGQTWGAVAGGATGGIMGSQLSMAIFGEGKTQSTAGGAVGGAAGGYAGSGNIYGAGAGAVIGGVLGYLMG